jgi:hypothetical protein
MALSERSRYAEGEFHWIETNRGSRYTVYLNTITHLTSPYIVHVVVEGETLALLAAKYYSDVNRWWVLADANPHAFYPAGLTPGMNLRIPQ